MPYNNLGRLYIYRAEMHSQSHITYCSNDSNDIEINDLSIQ